MCGSTAAQDTVQQEDIATMKLYQQEQQQQFAAQQALFAKVTSVLDPILNAGPNQEGFSAAEKANLNAQTVEGTAENYRSAARATGEAIAAEGGGGTGMPSGSEEQLKAEIATSAAEEESKEQTQVEEQNYATGRSNFQNAEEGVMAVAAGENPLGYGQNVINAEKTSGDEANAIAEAQNSWVNAAIGAAGAIGGAATGASITKWG